MKINFDSPITDLKGEEVKTKELNVEKPFLLKDVSVNALLNEVPLRQGETAQTGIQKFKKYELSRKIFVGGEVEITAEEITLLKKCIGESYGALVVGSAYDIIEGKE